MHTSYIELSESAVKNNINFIKQLIGEDVIFSSVVKGNAYGHGIKTYCPLAYKFGARHFSVSDAVEAFEVLDCLKSNDITIMIMGMIDNQHLEWAIENDIEFFVFEIDRLQAALAAAQKVGKPAKIHIEFETGMNRTGFIRKDFNTVLKFLKSNLKDIHVKGICTHLAGAESIANYKRITDQQKKFKTILNYLKRNDWDIPQVHMASSAATIRYPKTRYDLVRNGIVQYGFFPTQEILVHYLSKHKNNINPLRRVLSWKTKVMDVKTIKEGQYIGYGNSFFTNTPTKIAIIPVGYSSGYNRSLSNKGKVLIRGKRLDVIGTVNMNMMIVDISEASDIMKGDEVVLIGNQGDQEITVSSFSDLSQIINYELLTQLPKDIERKIVI